MRVCERECCSLHILFYIHLSKNTWGVHCSSMLPTETFSCFQVLIKTIMPVDIENWHIFSCVFQNAVSLLEVTPDFKCGKLLVTHKGVWGQICGDYMDDRGAAVVCRQLGLKGGKQALKHPNNDLYPMATIWLEKFRCTGNEESLDECYLSAKEGNCRTGAALVCCDDEVLYVCTYIHLHTCIYIHTHTVTLELRVICMYMHTFTYIHCCTGAAFVCGVICMYIHTFTYIYIHCCAFVCCASLSSYWYCMFRVGWWYICVKMHNKQS